MRIEFVLHHNGRDWVAENDLGSFSAPSLEQVDSEIEKYVNKRGWLRDSNEVEAFMSFDNATIPPWIRQYAQHYFNRVVRFKK